MFKLRFPEEQISHWADRYSYPSEDRVENEIAPVARERGYLTWSEFVEICRWKTPRTQPLVKTNAREIVEAVTRAALESLHDDVKINVLRALRGVSWPTASVILHFCDKKTYPIVDFRALWSLGYSKPPTYTLELWLAYTTFIRELSTRTGRSMRTVDRALWQYSHTRPAEDRWHYRINSFIRSLAMAQQRAFGKSRTRWRQFALPSQVLAEVRQELREQVESLGVAAGALLSAEQPPLA